MNKHETPASKRVPLQQARQELFEVLLEYGEPVAGQQVVLTVIHRHRTRAKVMLDARVAEFLEPMLLEAYELGLHDGAEESL